MRMYRQAEALNINKAMMLPRIIWTAMLASLAVYLFIGHYFIEKGTITTAANFPIDVLRTVLYGISILTIAGIKHFRSAIMSRKSEQKRSIHVTNAPQHPVLLKYTTAMVFSMAMDEIVGVYGLVLALMGGSGPGTSSRTAQRAYERLGFSLYEECRDPSFTEEIGSPGMQSMVAGMTTSL